MPGDVSLSGIEFQIKGSSDSASGSIQKLIDYLNRLKDALSRLISANHIKAFFGNLKKDVSGLSGAFRKVSGVFKEVNSALLGIGKSGAKSFFSALSLPVKAATKNVSGLAKSLGGVLGGFKRIVGYRIIRSIIKEITQGFSEGIKNLYGWSQMMGGATINGMNFAQTMDNLATSFLYFKNSVGAAAAPLISALAPAIDFVIDKAVALLNIINQLLAKLAGATSWNRAVKKATEYGDAVSGAGSAAKEALAYLAPFDELNRLPSDNSGSGGGGSSDDYSGMFEEVSEFNEGIADFAQAIKDAVNAGDWQGLGTLLGNKVNELIDMIDFAGIGTKVGQGINAWFTTKYWALETINFSNIGTNIATFLNNMMSEIDFETIGRSLTQKFTNLGDLILGAVQTINWSTVGQSIGDLIRGAFDQISEWLEGIDWQTVGYNLYNGLKDAVEGIDFASVAESLFRLLGAAIAAAVSLVGTFVNEAWQDIKGYFAQYMPSGWDSTGEEIINGILLGVKNAVLGVGAWISENVLQPFVSGVKSAFGIASPASTMIEPGQMIAEGILEGMLQPFKNIVSWVDEHIVQPIRNALTNFSIKDLLLNKDEGTTTVSTDEIFSGKLNLEAVVSDITDNIPAAKKVVEGVKGVVDNIGEVSGGIKDKVIDGVKGVISNVAEVAGGIKDKVIGGVKALFGSTDNGASLSSSAKSIDANANLTSYTKAFTSKYQTTSSGSPKLNTQANLTSYIKAFGGSYQTTKSGSPKLNTQANLTSYIKDFGDAYQTTSSGSPKINSQANFNSRRITDLNRVFNSKANFTSRDISNLNRTFNSEANFTDWSDDIPWWDRPSIDGNVNFVSYTGNPLVDFDSSTASLFLSKGGTYYGGDWHRIPQAASGGNFHGTLFWAGENGAEVVGHAGGRTEVLNRSQLAATMYAAVHSAMNGIAFNVSSPNVATSMPSNGTNEDALYRAMLRALNDSDVSDRPIELDGNVIYKNVVKRNRMERTRTGMNPMLSY